MKVVSFNIRCDFQQDGDNSFIFRRPLILEKIQQEKPDIIGFQEVLPHVHRWLQDNLTGYTVVGCGREADLTGESMTIAIRNETTQLIRLDTFWLSPTPLEPGSRYPDQSDCPRTCTRAILLHQDSQTPIRFYNTHLDHISSQARLQGLTQLLCQMERDTERYPYPILLTGDFNAVPDSPEMEPLKEHPNLMLRDVTTSLPFTFHNYFHTPDVTSKIDYIFVSSVFQAKQVCCWKEEENGVYLSDHYPVCAELTR